MYGIEESTGLGGLAAQAPGGNMYLPAALRIRNPGAGIIGDPTSGIDTLPYSIGNTPLGGRPTVSMGGGAVERPVGHMHGSWRQILDFHNSVAPWVLILLFIVYAHNHVSYRRRGRGL